MSFARGSSVYTLITANEPENNIIHLNSYTTKQQSLFPGWKNLNCSYSPDVDIAVKELSPTLIVS